jgi:hypothetical protein
MTSYARMKLTAALFAAAPTAFVLAPQAAAQGLPPIQREFSNGSTLQFYGQINKGILQYDDGIDTRSYTLIDNDNSNTRVGLKYTQSFGAWAFENVNEFSYAPYSTGNMNILQDSPTSEDYEFTNANIRKIDFTLANDAYGKFWLGQGSMATDGILEIDLSGTDVIAYSGVADSAGAQIIRFSDPALADDFSGPQIFDVFLNLDGDRRARVRYDTPEFANFTGAVAFGRNLLSDDSEVRDQNIFDASLFYDNSYGDIEVQAGLGYNWQDSDTSVWGGSASALHSPTGVNFTLAAGKQNGAGDQDGTFWYSKLGLLRDFFSTVGDTAMSIDYYSGDDFNLDDSIGLDSSSSKSWGLALVQNIDRANTQLWLTYRGYDYSDDIASYEDGTAIFGGARFQF